MSSYGRRSTGSGHIPQRRLHFDVSSRPTVIFRGENFISVVIPSVARDLGGRVARRSRSSNKIVPPYRQVPRYARDDSSNDLKTLPYSCHEYRRALSAAAR